MLKRGYKDLMRSLVFSGTREPETEILIAVQHAVLVNRLLDRAPSKILPQIEIVLQKLETIEVRLSDKLITCAGQAWFGKNRIDLHRRLLRTDPESLGKTYAHELGHLIANHLFGETGHGLKWKLVMAWLDSNAERTHDLDVSAFRKNAEFVRRAA
jgi:hypothetical protein